ncbi:MAG: FadR family transcriptional regulator [Burkholderiaceae bacterium]|nr:FadR family transcriptional regulator [Pseudomonadota bacterium]MBS0597475.1 FadR family transcriptional regulator [Pseudomonadota bacterium]MCO5114814.1 FadR family transcriptional regulator [Burkholderiaceae bacterium]MCP5218795.1 FadR family transcriptional regulator [Burkholderiaceae bacterium]
MPLQTVEPQRLYRQIANQLRALIDNGEFAPGARLPAERDLAQQLGVSRPSVREALIALEVERCVEVRTGSGVYVLERTKPSAPAAEATGWGPLELIRARRAIEGEVAALAARNARVADDEAIADAITGMKVEIDRGGAMLQDSDREFHLAIARAAGNAVLAETIEGYLGARYSTLSKRLGGYFETSRAWRTTVDEHERVRAAILARNPEDARSAMIEHLDKVHQRFSASWRQAHPPA